VQPSAGIVDSQSVKTSEAGGPRGSDAGKKINGRKRHLVTDTLGLPLALAVHTADLQDRDGLALACARIRRHFPRLAHLFADGGYQGAVAAAAAARERLTLEIVKRPADRRWLRGLAPSLGDRAQLRLAVPQPPPRQGLREAHRRLHRHACRRHHPAPHPPPGKSLITMPNFPNGLLGTGVVVTDEVTVVAHTYAKRSLAEMEFFVGLCAGKAMQKRERVLNSHVELEAVAAPEPQAARRLWGKIKQGEMSDNLAEDIWRVVRDLDDVAEVAYRMLFSGQRAQVYAESGFLRFLLSCEQAPNPSSRVTLANEEDSMGLRRSRLDWRLTDLDRRTFEPLTKSLAAEFPRLNIGRVRLANWLLGGNDPIWGSEIVGSSHHMGTTRMAAEPERGVVDADCRVHHVDNLYVAGSSVFPTGGSVKPTLTIVALASRLADHLKGRLA
jgi:choline dehydrogenase-like flavoprotein